MIATAPRTLLAPVRAHAKTLFAPTDEAHNEWLALVWGPRFDRTHALGLLQRLPRLAPDLLKALTDAADRFDAMASAEQQHLRRLILRHRSRWENAACTASF
ncbi:hypothetical protein BH10PSE16_BH10PSE16_27070 [soil metagenome]